MGAMDCPWCRAGMHNQHQAVWRPMPGHSMQIRCRCVGECRAVVDAQLVRRLRQEGGIR